ncbi:MAG: PEP-CTERM sorting domain-containing protein [Rhizobacter sp.]|nr:PEP-CTERM sorting domain-containing protein [Rhizobacter sp.]
MLKRLARCSCAASALAASLACGSAFAAPCTGVNVGTSQTSDVTFAGLASDACVIANDNAQSGPSGDTSGFDGTFGTGWSLLGKLPPASGTSTLSGVNFTWGFTGSGTGPGTWTLTADRNVTLDLVFAMHAGSYTGAFLFDDQALVAGQTGSWRIDWINKGEQNPSYSNLTLFARDIMVTSVPEPETYALMLAGLGIMGFIARRRRPD